MQRTNETSAPPEKNDITEIYPHLIFVYGTLMKDEHNHRLLEGMPCVSREAYIKGSMYHLGGFPGVIDIGKPGAHGRIKGEVYLVSSLCLARLDRLEGFNPNGDPERNMYNRVHTDCHLKWSENADKEKDPDWVTVMVYEYNADKKSLKSYGNLIKSGQWKSTQKWRNL